MSGVQQGDSINACVLLCVRDRCLSNVRLSYCCAVLCCVAVVGLVDRSDGKYGGCEDPLRRRSDCTAMGI